ncbi:MAG: magnesium-dependent phosphatase-1 [Verrucomicrobia bacterium]|nr:magnesium-dependent phosphatase-1 [Verrucomicrobiota bacterium]
MMFPELIVFDLDFTLWDCGGTWCDCLRPPFVLTDGMVRDAYGRHIHLYPEVLSILDDVDEMGIPMGIASRTDRPDWARQLLELLGVKERFAYQEIFPGSKVTHIKNIASASGIPLNAMLFFDDEQRNLHDLRPLGVHCKVVPNGLNEVLFSKGLEIFA